MKSLIRGIWNALLGVFLMAAAGRVQAQTTEGFVTRLPSTQQQSTTADLRRSVISKAQSMVDEAKSNIAAGAEPISRARGDYESDPSTDNAVNMIQACVEAIKNAVPATQEVALAATSANRACGNQLDDIQKGERELTVVLQHAGARGTDLKNLAANYDTVVERLRSRFAMEADLTPTQESMVLAALFNSKLSHRTTEHTEWTFGELLAALKELQDAKAEIQTRALGFQRQAQQAQMVRGHFNQTLANFESVLAAWKTTGETREFRQQTEKLEGDIGEIVNGLANIIAGGMPALAPAASREEPGTKARSRNTLERLLGGSGTNQWGIEVVNGGGAR
jgi:hypothetical protein